MPESREEFKYIQAYEKGLASAYRYRAMLEFFRSLNLKTPYTIRTLPELLQQLKFSFKYKKLQLQRAYFNVSPLGQSENKAIFLDKRLPYRSAMKQAGKLHQYEENIQRLLERFHFFKVTYYPDYCEKVPFDDYSSQYLFCGQILELFHNRLDLIENLLSAKPHGFHVQFCRDMHQTFFDPGYIQINPITLWAENDAPRFPGVTHAFLHLLSRDDEGQQTDYIFDMPEVYRQTILKLKADLEAEFFRKDIGFQSLIWTILTDKTRSGLNHYAFYGEQAEFLTTALENCIKRPNSVRKTKLGQELLAFFSGYFKWAEPYGGHLHASGSAI